MVVTRFYSLDEQPGLVRKVSDFAEQLASGDGGSKERTCGFLPFRGNGSAEADFARILQTMIGKTLNPGENQSAMSSIMSRIRIFEDSTCNFDLGNGERATFTECRSTQFRRLRALASVPEEHYVASMCSKPFKGQSGQGGKSGAFFLKTHDERYIVKTIADHEFDCLRDILPNYLLYLEENRASLLSRFYGAYALTIGHSTLRVVVMGNCLMGAQSQVYDLKGTTEDRWVDPVQHSVLKDTNFSPYTILLEAGRVDQLRRVIQDDAEFLECCGLMDYSLLVGVASSADASDDGAGGGAHVTESPPSLGVVGGWLHSEAEPRAQRRFQLGIIDYLQRWTPKKVAAHWLKKLTIGCTQEIDTEPPTVYASRFYKYFAVKIVPA